MSDAMKSADSAKIKTVRELLVAVTRSTKSLSTKDFQREQTQLKKLLRLLLNREPTADEVSQAAAGS